MRRDTMATSDQPINDAIQDATKTAITAAIQNSRPLAYFDEYQHADTAATHIHQ